MVSRSCAEMPIISLSFTFFLLLRCWPTVLLVAETTASSSSSSNNNRNSNHCQRSGSNPSNMAFRVRGAASTVRRSSAAAFVTPSSSHQFSLPCYTTSRIPYLKHNTAWQKKSTHPFSTMALGSAPSTNEILDFGDLDYFNNDNNNIQQFDEKNENPVVQNGPISDSSSNNNIENQTNQEGNNNPKKDNNEQEKKNGKKHTNDNTNLDTLLQGIKSQPKEGGTWNPPDPLAWAQTFGSRSPANAERLASLIHLRAGDEGYFDVDATPDSMPDGVTIVRTPEQAEIVMKALMKSKADDPDRIHACDTEVMDIDLKMVGPVGHGYVTCLSVYSGEDFDYGLGDGPGTMLWVDNLDDACGVLHEFKAWLEDEHVLKVWHNYGFDRHVLYNEGINVLGLGGDTMHMARLSDTSRMKYSLESLTEDLLGQRKVPMKEIFGEARLRKDGTPGALVDLPPMERLQRDPKYRHNWIKYSCYDAKSTYNLYQNLKEKLVKTSWFKDYSLMDYYHLHMRPFGELLTDLERRGILVSTE
mmetsp:Transcript_39359/g.72103  ORF Transcript_39359/g.72103 Transcript_39359/m.72103 type:complete len:528 (-) Transcript_39359:10-1593(-)